MSKKEGKLMHGILMQKPTDAVNDFAELVAAVRGMRKKEKVAFALKSQELCKFYTSKKKKTTTTENPLAALESKWFDSIKDGGEPDYSVYSDHEYLLDAWTCWILYSRKYLRSIFLEKASTFVPELSSGIKRVLDVGCGLGFSTAAFSEIFPSAEVIGTNLPGEQYEICKCLAEGYGFKLITNHKGVGTVDIVFASEYFEHFLEPIEELRLILRHTTPTYLLVANSFNTDGIGHFHYYKVDGVEVPAKKMSRIFTNFLEMRGYEKVETSLWNNTPAIFKLM